MQNLTPKPPKAPSKLTSDSRATNRPALLHQMIAEKVPELHANDLILPHLVVQAEDTVAETESVRTITRHNRVSSYDNVDRQQYASSATYSDEGTVFSEPWDNSQWERMIPESTKDSSRAFFYWIYEFIYFFVVNF